MSREYLKACAEVDRLRARLHLAEGLEASLEYAQNELIFWQEHNRESPNAMIGPGQSIKNTLAKVRYALAQWRSNQPAPPTEKPL